MIVGSGATHGFATLAETDGFAEGLRPLCIVALSCVGRCHWPRQSHAWLLRLGSTRSLSPPLRRLMKLMKKCCSSVECMDVWLGLNGRGKDAPICIANVSLGVKARAFWYGEGFAHPICFALLQVCCPCFLFLFFFVTLSFVADLRHLAFGCAHASSLCPCRLSDGKRAKKRIPCAEVG